MAADATLVNAAFREAKSRAGATSDTPGVIDQSALYQSTVSQSRQFLGAITGAMKTIDDKMQKNKLGTEQQLKGFDKIGDDGLRKLYAQQEPLPDEIILAIEDYIKDLQTEFDKVNTYGDKDTSENEKARIKLEAKLSRVINEAINTRAGFTKIFDTLKNGKLNVEQISRNRQNIDPMRQVLEWVSSGVSNPNVSVVVHPETGRLTYTSSTGDGSSWYDPTPDKPNSGDEWGNSVYMNISDMEKYLPTGNTGHQTLLLGEITTAEKSGLNGGVDGKYNREASINAIANDETIKTLEDFQSAMDQDHPHKLISFTRDLPSNVNIPLSLIQHAFPDDENEVWSDMYWAALEMDSEEYGGDGDGVLEQSELDAAKSSGSSLQRLKHNMFMEDAEALIDVITNTTNPLFSESTSKDLYAQWVTDINEGVHDDKINANIAKAEKAEGKGKGKEGLNVVGGQQIPTATWNKIYTPYIDFLNNPTEGQVMQSPKGYRVEYKNGDFYLGGEKVNSAQDAAEPDGLMNYVTATAAQEEDIMDTPIGQSGFTLKDYKKIGGEWFYVRGGEKQKVVASTTINQLEDALKKTEGTGGVDEEQI